MTYLKGCNPQVMNEHDRQVKSKNTKNSSLNKIGFFGYISMMFFLLVLTIGFIYEWKKGALEWE